MTYFDPMAPSSLWWLAYRNHLCNARRFPADGNGYSRAAAIAYTQYLCYDAQETVKEKSNG